MPLWTPVNVFLICCSIEESILTRVLTALGYNDWFSFPLVGECMGMGGDFDTSFLLFGILVDTYRPSTSHLCVNEYHAWLLKTNNNLQTSCQTIAFYSWFSTLAGESKLGLEKSQLIFITWNYKFTFLLLLMNVGKLMLLTGKCLESKSLRKYISAYEYRLQQGV